MRMRTTVAAAAAAAMMLGFADTASAAKCSTKMLVGAWAETDFEKGDAPEDVDICLIQFNTKGQVMTSSCFTADDTKMARGSDRVSGKLSVTKACEVTGKLRFRRQVVTLTGTLNPSKGIMTLRAKGTDPIVYNQQW